MICGASTAPSADKIPPAALDCREGERREGEGEKESGRERERREGEGEKESGREGERREGEGEKERGGEGDLDVVVPNTREKVLPEAFIGGEGHSAEYNTCRYSLSCGTSDWSKA